LFVGVKQCCDPAVQCAIISAAFAQVAGSLAWGQLQGGIKDCYFVAWGIGHFE
jgi:hypothetical protein